MNSVLHVVIAYHELEVIVSTAAKSQRVPEHKYTGDLPLQSGHHIFDCQMPWVLPQCSYYVKESDDHVSENKPAGECGQPILKETQRYSGILLSERLKHQGKLIVAINQVLF